MGNNFFGQMVVVLTAITGVAIVATLVSKNARTPEVIGSFWKGFGGALSAATSPVTGGSSHLGLSLPSLPNVGLGGVQF